MAFLSLHRAGVNFCLTYLTSSLQLQCFPCSQLLHFLLFLLVLSLYHNLFAMTKVISLSQVAVVLLLKFLVLLFLDKEHCLISMSKHFSKHEIPFHSPRTYRMLWELISFLLLSWWVITVSTDFPWPITTTTIVPIFLPLSLHLMCAHTKKWSNWRKFPSTLVL